VTWDVWLDDASHSDEESESDGDSEDATPPLNEQWPPPPRRRARGERAVFAAFGPAGDSGGAANSRYEFSLTPQLSSLPVPTRPSECHAVCDTFGVGCPSCTVQASDEAFNASVARLTTIKSILVDFWLPRARKSLAAWDKMRYDYFGRGFGNPGEVGKGLVMDREEAVRRFGAVPPRPPTVPRGPSALPFSQRRQARARAFYELTSAPSSVKVVAEGPIIPLRLLLEIRGKKEGPPQEPEHSPVFSIVRRCVAHADTAVRMASRASVIKAPSGKPVYSSSLRHVPTGPSSALGAPKRSFQFDSHRLSGAVSGAVGAALSRSGVAASPSEGIGVSNQRRSTQPVFDLSSVTSPQSNPSPPKSDTPHSGFSPDPTSSRKPGKPAPMSKRAMVAMAAALHRIGSRPKQLDADLPPHLEPPSPPELEDEFFEPEKTGVHPTLFDEFSLPDGLRWTDTARASTARSAYGAFGSSRYKVKSTVSSAPLAVLIEDFEGSDQGELEAKEGWVVAVEEEDPSGWWSCRVVGSIYGSCSRLNRSGFLPCTFLRWAKAEDLTWVSSDSTHVRELAPGDERLILVEPATPLNTAVSMPRDKPGLMQDGLWQFNPGSDLWERFDAASGTVETSADPFAEQWVVEGIDDLDWDDDAMTQRDASSETASVQASALRTASRAGLSSARASDQQAVQLGVPYVAHTDYAGEDDGEIALVAGDIVFVQQFDDSGWWEGLNQRTGLIGWLPSTFVRQVKSDSTVGSPWDSPRSGFPEADEEESGGVWWSDLPRRCQCLKEWEPSPEDAGKQGFAFLVVLAGDQIVVTHVDVEGEWAQAYASGSDGSVADCAWLPVSVLEPIEEESLDRE
jgi:hypothetical protein